MRLALATSWWKIRRLISDPALTIQHSMLRLLLLATLVTSVAGCGSWWLPRPHKIDIQQGNLLDESAIGNIVEGMSKAQVQDKLGNPLLQQSFRPDRWDYVYSLNRSGEQPEGERLTLFFEEGRVTRIERGAIGQQR